MPAKYVYYKWLSKQTEIHFKTRHENGETTKSLRDLTIPFAIVNNFCDVTRLKCRLTGLHKYISTLNYINQVHSIWEGKLSKMEDIIQRVRVGKKKEMKEQ